MTYRVVMSPEAATLLSRFVDYVAVDQQSPLSAERWLRKTLAAVESLYRFPRRCPLAPENEMREYEIRMLVISPAIFLFSVDDTDEVVRIIGFRHERQLPKDERLPADI